MPGGNRRWAVQRAWIFALVFLVGVLAAHAWAQSSQGPSHAASREVILRLDPAQSELHWTLGSTLHTVHGTFALKPGEVRFDPADGSASGEFTADATTGESGNESRDKKMHREILESARYTEVAFRPDRIEGKGRSWRKALSP